MAERIDLTDPDFEPTDEQLVALSRRAFSGVAAQRRQTQESLRARIQAAREGVLERLERGDFGSTVFKAR